jgi:hypothetical protein
MECRLFDEVIEWSCHLLRRMSPVGTENLIRVDEAMESPKLAE